MPFQPKRNWWLWLSVSILLSLLFFIDLFVRYPYGLLKWHSIAGLKLHGPLETCGWDYEGSWKIGIARGTSPITLKHGKEPVITCATVKNVPVSFVADPFLVLPLTGQKGTWYAFYEMKNLERFIGEIGVASSKDEGKTWEHLGTALAEPFHLSYPLVFFSNETQKYYMMPETSQDQSIRVYETDLKSFPFGWQLHKKLFTGKRFVDSSMIFYEGYWWLFTSVEYSLHIYSSRDFLGHFVEHPKSPVVTTSRKIGRSGGPVIAHDEYLFRYAQDCSRYYGEKMHLFRIEITPHDYKETLIKTIKPPATSWNSQRFHHVDAHKLADGNWIALVDGDDHPDDYQFFLREGWWFYSKRIFLALVVLQLAVGLWRTKGLRYTLKSRAKPVTMGFQNLAQPRLKSMFSFIWTILKRLFWLLALGISIFVVVTTLIWSTGTLCDVCPEGQDGLRLLEKNRGASASDEDFVVMTATSRGFFDRLQNFVGSFHFWEPNQKIVVYNLGLEPEQLASLKCWKNVEVRKLNFSSYPAHVKNLYNFAWKHIMMMDAFKYNKRVLYIDSGGELRQPLDAMKKFLFKHGYISSTQPNTIDRKTLPETLSHLGVDLEDVKGVPFCCGGLQGFVKGTYAFDALLKPSVACALDEACISPPGAGKENHNFDQSVISALVYKNGYHCLKESKYSVMDFVELTTDEKNYNEALLAFRRWHIERPYVRYLVKAEGCQQNLTAEEMNGVDIIENNQADHIKHDSPLAICLQKNHNQREPCKHLINSRDKAVKKIPWGMYVEQRWKKFLPRLVKTWTCQFVRIVILQFVVLIEVLSYLLKGRIRKWMRNKDSSLSVKSKV